MTDEFSALLRRRREELQDALGIARDEIGHIHASRSAATGDDEHDPEGSTLSDDWARAAGYEADLRVQLAEAEAALARIASGAYGSCERCGRPIPLDRLRVRPAARTCVHC